MWTDMATILTPDRMGEATIRHFTVDEALASRSRVRAAATRGRDPSVEVGTYAQLFVRGALVMSDTTGERESNEDVVYAARGDVLIAGLGLGMVLLPILAKDNVDSVRVVEKSKDVIRMVTPRIQEAAGANALKLVVELGDIYTWWPTPPRTRWDTIYFDIWPNIVLHQSFREMQELHKRFRPKLRPRGWMSSWHYEDLKAGWL